MFLIIINKSVPEISIPLLREGAAAHFAPIGLPPIIMFIFVSMTVLCLYLVFVCLSQIMFILVSLPVTISVPEYEFRDYIYMFVNISFFLCVNVCWPAHSDDPLGIRVAYVSGFSVLCLFSICMLHFF